MISKHIGPTDKHVKSPPPPFIYKSCKTIYKIQGGGGTYYFSCENFITQISVGSVGNVPSKNNRKKMDFGAFCCIF